MRAALPALLALSLAGCFQAKAKTDWYRCESDDQCAAGQACDDGVCCDPSGGLPWCPTQPLPSGGCPDGGVTSSWYPDLDKDGFGPDVEVAQKCARPVLSTWVQQGGDCLDAPQLGETTYPGAPELCDALDNDCDGAPDDGLDGGQDYFRDQDNDKYGDPNDKRWYCAKPEGWVVNGSDCAPADPYVNPDAVERCNAVDDNCDGYLDNGVPGTGGDCVETTRKGICQDGFTDCRNATLVCTQAFLPRPEELCNQQDDTCDAVVDEAPGCGGHANLLTGVGLSRGAQDVGRGTNGNGWGLLDGGYSCLKGVPGATPEVFSQGVWTGTGSNTHVAWVERSDGRTWDLTKPDAGLHAKFTAVLFNSGDPAWQLLGQPSFLLCDEQGGFLRIRYNAQGSATPLFVQDGGTFTYDEFVPLAGNSRWLRGVSGNVDMTRVVRVEMMVQPGPKTGSPPPGFNFNFQKLGFETR
jgi:hypothetical protein